MKVIAVMTLVLAVASTDTQEKFTTNLCSLAFFYSVGIVSCVIITFGVFCTKEFTFVDFDKALRSIVRLVFYSYIVFSPIAAWFDSMKLSQYLNSWTEYQQLHYKICGTKLELPFKKYSWTVVSVSVVGILTVDIVFYYVFSGLNIGVLVVVCYINITRAVVTVLWHLMCLQLTFTGQKLASKISETVRSTPTAILRDYKLLWLRLNKLSRRLGTTLYHLYGFNVLYLLTKLTLDCYNFLFRVLYDEKILHVKVITTVFITCVDLLLIFTMFNSAHKVSHQIGDKMLETVLFIRICTSSGCTSIEELDSFIQVIHMQSSDINLGGYITLKRHKLVTLGSMIVMYLVILLQFKQTSISGTSTNRTSVLSVMRKKL